MHQRFRTSLSSLDSASSLRSDRTRFLDRTTDFRLPLWDRASAEFCFARSRELLTRPLMRDSSDYYDRDLSYHPDYFDNNQRYYQNDLNAPGHVRYDVEKQRRPTVQRANSDRTERRFDDFYSTFNAADVPRSDGFQRKKYDKNFEDATRPRTSSFTCKRRSIRARNMRRRQSCNFINNQSSSSSDFFSSSSDSEAILSRSGSLRSSSYNARPHKGLRRQGSAASLFTPGLTGSRRNARMKNSSSLLKPNFDVTKLTGKSPPAAPQEGKNGDEEFSQQFRWPPVLPGGGVANVESTVSGNQVITLTSPITSCTSTSSSDDSLAEFPEFSQDFLANFPPSPAP